MSELGLGLQVQIDTVDGGEVKVEEKDMSPNFGGTVDSDFLEEEEEEEEDEVEGVEDEPLEVDLLIAWLDSQRTPDHLNLREGKHIQVLQRVFSCRCDGVQQMLQNQAKVDERSKVEEVVFSDYVTKINRKGREQRRALLITDRALYNIQPGSDFRRLKRRIDITKTNGVTVSEKGDEFVVHVEGEYDYHFRSIRRGDIVHFLGRAHLLLTGRELKADISELDDLSAKVKDKVLMKKWQRLDVLNEQKRRNTTQAFNKIRRKVRKKKKSFVTDEFDLDFSYITDRIIAMGYPAEQLASLYRNPYSEVYRILQQRHRDHYRVYNLCVEKTYDAKKFHNRVAHFPFQDHNCPPMKMILEFCQDVTMWLALDPANVIAVHCKAGKGRTGLMIACYLLFAGLFSNAQTSLEFFARQRHVARTPRVSERPNRTKNGQGVTIPSQKRYVAYFERFLREYYAPRRPFSFAGRSLILTTVRLTTVPHVSRGGGCTPFFKVFTPKGEKLHDSRRVTPARTVRPRDGFFVTIPSSLSLRGDVKLSFFNEEQLGKNTKLFHFWLNTNFIEDNRFVLQKIEIDNARKDTMHKKFDAKFRVELFFRPDELVAERVFFDPQSQSAQNQQLPDEEDIV